ncbi:MAG: hypothetical protein QOJ31_1262 [Gaiellales bacterium]|jgi:hypothetical protein|nr:hypothetical protein [Gaiellales bacterium]MDX6550578.1 hypothetical protein [Gaiellales bacterium]
MGAWLEKTVPLALLLAVAGTGCAGADPSAVRLPAPAQALAVAPDFAGTLWETTGDRAWRSQDGGRSWQPVAGRMGGVGVAFTDYGSEVVGPKGGQRGDYGGRRLGAPHQTPGTFISVSAPYHRTNRLYAIDVFGGLWLSVDAGDRWTRLRANRLPTTAVAVAAVRGDVERPDVIYAAAGKDGLWRSRDDGATFRHVLDVPQAYAIALTTDDQRLVLVAGDQLYLSTDSGQTFLPVLKRRVAALAYDPRNHRLAYAAVDGQLLRSVDGGRTWP